MKIYKYFSKLINLMKYLISFLIILSLGLLFLNIVLRGFFSFSFSWVEGSTIYLVMWIVFLGVGLIYWDDEHLTMDFLYEKLSTAVKQKVDKIIYTLVVLTSLFLLVFGSVLTYDLYSLKQMSYYGDIPLYLVTISIPMGSLVCIISILKRVFIKDERSE